MGNVSWESVAAAVVVATTLTTLLNTIITPYADKIWLRTLSRNKSSVKETLNGWYGTQEASRKLEAVERDVKDLYRRLGELVQNQEREFADVAETVRDAVDTNGGLLRDAVDKIEGVSRQVAHLYGLVRQDPWDGRTERRHGDRRE